MIEQDTKIVFNRKLAPDFFLMALESPQIVSEATPGQFVMIRVRKGSDPLLRRPFSICGTIRDNQFLILYKVVGRGTAFLSEARAGAKLSVLGVLGRGFEQPKRACESILVAGGIGIAPLIFLAQTIKHMNVTFMIGYRSANEILPMEQFSLNTIDPFISTDDGSAGHHGPVTELLEHHLLSSVKNPPMVFACGPTPMLKRVADLTINQDIPCQVSQETNMACGLGACQGCAVRASSGKDRMYYHVCQDGPVFDVHKLDWKAL
jgi:dihydroorotate dehydrogenase electron transfer subunit